MPENETTLTVSQAAAFLQLHPNTVRLMAEDGRLPAKKVGNQWRFLPSALAERVKPSNVVPAT